MFYSVSRESYPHHKRPKCRAGGKNGDHGVLEKSCLARDSRTEKDGSRPPTHRRRARANCKALGLDPVDRSRQNLHRNGKASRRVGNGAGNPRGRAQRVRQHDRQPGLGRADPGRSPGPVASDLGERPSRSPRELHHADQVGDARPPEPALRQHRVAPVQDGSPHRRSADARKPAGPQCRLGSPVPNLHGRLSRPPGLASQAKNMHNALHFGGALVFLKTILSF